MDYRHAGIKRAREESTEEYEPNKKIKTEVFKLAELPKEIISEILGLALQCNPFLTETCKLFHDAAHMFDKQERAEEVRKFGAVIKSLGPVSKIASFCMAMRLSSNICKAANIKENPIKWKFDTEWMTQNGPLELVKRAVTCRFITTPKLVERLIMQGEIESIKQINPCNRGVFADEKGCHHFMNVSMKHNQPECLLYFLEVLEGKDERYLAHSLDVLTRDVFTLSHWIENDSVECLKALWNHVTQSSLNYKSTIVQMGLGRSDQGVFLAKKCTLFLMEISESYFSWWVESCLKNDFPEGIDQLYKGLQFKRSHCPQTSIQGVKCAAMCGRECEGLEVATAGYWIRNGKSDLFKAFVSEANERVKANAIEVLISSVDRDEHFLAIFVKIALDHGCAISPEARSLVKSKNMFAVSLLLNQGEF